MTASSPNVIEIKLDRLIDDMRLLRSQMIAFDRHLNGIEAYLKPSEQQPESKSRPWAAAAAIAMARTVLIFFAVGAATSAVSGVHIIFAAFLAWKWCRLAALSESGRYGGRGCGFKAARCGGRGCGFNPEYPEA